MPGRPAARAGLEETRRWWHGLMDTLRVQTSEPEFDRYLDWLKYQALAERIWARRGFYQASGAFGFRDQLQDSVNLIWMDPARGAPADPPARLPAVPRGRRRPLVPPAPGRPDRLRRADARLGQPALAAPGPSSSTSRRPATSPSSTSGRPTSRRSSRSSRCPPASTAWGSTPCGRRARTRSTGMPEGDRPRARPADGRARAAPDRHRRLERRARRDRQPGPRRERLARLLPPLHPRPDGRLIETNGTARSGRTTTSAGSPRSRTPWSGPGETTATCGRSTTTAPRSASRAAASGRSTP